MVFWMVHLEAKRRGLEGLAPEDCPNAWQALRSRWYLVLPLAGLVWLLFAGYTPMYAGMAGLALTAVLVLGTAVAAMLSRQAFRYLFWIAVGVWGGAGRTLGRLAGVAASGRVGSGAPLAS